MARREEEAWSLTDYEWDPASMLAKRIGGDAGGSGRASLRGAGGSGALLGTTHRKQASFGSGDLAAGDAPSGNVASIAHQQLMSCPQFTQNLPVLATSKAQQPLARGETPCCVVEGCGRSLTGLKRYFVRMRMCEEHLSAPAVVVDGTLSRFCQQCGKFQFLGEFTAGKKSCSATLERHNERHRQKMALKAAQQQQQGGAKGSKQGNASLFSAAALAKGRPGGSIGASEMQRSGSMSEVSGALGQQQYKHMLELQASGSLGRDGSPNASGSPPASGATSVSALTAPMRVVTTMTGQEQDARQRLAAGGAYLPALQSAGSAGLGQLGSDAAWNGLAAPAEIRNVLLAAEPNLIMAGAGAALGISSYSKPRSSMDSGSGYAGSPSLLPSLAGSAVDPMRPRPAGLQQQQQLSSAGVLAAFDPNRTSSPGQSYSTAVGGPGAVGAGPGSVAAAGAPAGSHSSPSHDSSHLQGGAACTADSAVMLNARPLLGEAAVAEQVEAVAARVSGLVSDMAPLLAFLRQQLGSPSEPMPTGCANAGVVQPVIDAALAMVQEAKQLAAQLQPKVGHGLRQVEAGLQQQQQQLNYLQLGQQRQGSWPQAQRQQSAGAHGDWNSAAAAAGPSYSHGNGYGNGGSDSAAVSGVQGGSPPQDLSAAGGFMDAHYANGASPPQQQHNDWPLPAQQSGMAALLGAPGLWPDAPNGIGQGQAALLGQDGVLDESLLIDDNDTDLMEILHELEYPSLEAEAPALAPQQNPAWRAAASAQQAIVRHQASARLEPYGRRHVMPMMSAGVGMPEPLGPGPVRGHTSNQFQQQQQWPPFEPYGSPGSAGSTPSSGPSLADAYVDQYEWTRVSVKVMGLLPHELPPNLRSSLRKWMVEARAEVQQATLRPGCVQVVLDVQVPKPAAAAGPGLLVRDAPGERLAGLLMPLDGDPDQAAADIFRVLGQRLRDTYVQIGRGVLQVKVGSRPAVLSWADAAAEAALAEAKFPVIQACSAASVSAGSVARVTLTGQGLNQPSVKAFARLAGHDLPVTLESTEDASAADGSSRMHLSVALPPGQLGLMTVEVGVGHLLGGWWHVAVVPGEAVAEEVNEALRKPPADGELDAAAAEGVANAWAAGADRLLRDLSRLLVTYQAASSAQAYAAAAAEAASGASSASQSPPRSNSPTGTAPSTTAAAASAASAPGGRTSSPNGDATIESTWSSECSWAGHSTTQAASTMQGSTRSTALVSSSKGLHRASIGAPTPVLMGAPAPPPPSAQEVKQSVAKAAQLLRFAASRGMPELTTLVLAASEVLCNRSIDSLTTAAVEPQAYLHSAVASGSTATLDALAAFSESVFGTPLQLDAPGPWGMSALHLAAVLQDGGAMARHLLATQPWAPWLWLSSSWQPPKQAPTLLDGSVQQDDEAATSAAVGATEAEGDGTATVSAVNGATVGGAATLPLTPGSLAAHMGHEGTLELAVQKLTATAEPVGAPAGGPTAAALMAALEAWSNAGVMLMSALKAQLRISV